MTKPAWNKNKSVGQKKPLTALQIQFLQDYLSSTGNHRELALFSLQIDSMLRSSDLLKLKVEDIVDFKGDIKREINIKQKKTNNPHVIDISPKTADILAAYIKHFHKVESDYLFTSCSNFKRGHLNYVTHWKMTKSWCKILGVDPKDYGTHSGRRTRAVMVYKDTKDPKLIMNLLGQKDISSVTAYLGMDKQDSRDIYREKYLK